MTTIEVPCPTCAATGESTHEDRHAGTNMDTCRTCGGEGTVPARTGETPEASFLPPIDLKIATLALSYQYRVRLWLEACFGQAVADDRRERNHRFIEEALEFVQACGCTASEAHQLVDYVFGRLIGEKGQEAGAVMVTFAGACRAHGIVMTEVAEAELARCWQKTDAIREKWKGKPKHSPLPAVPADCHDLGQVVYEARWQGFTLGPRGAASAWSDLHESAKEIWRKAALAVRHAPWPPATPGRIVLQVDQGVEGLWYVTSPAPAGLLVAGETMRDALEQVEQVLKDMKQATAEVGGDAILVDDAVAKEALGVAKAIEAAQPSVAMTDTVALRDLAHILAAHMEEGQITPAGREMVSVALDRVFPKLLHTRERCEVAKCLVHGGCEECPTEAQLEAADAKLTAWLRENPRPDAVPSEARSLEAACEPWRFGLGGPPDNGSPLADVFSCGVTYALRELATLTNSAGWWLQNGSEDFQSNVRASLLDVLKHAYLYDPDTGRLASLTSVNDHGRTQVEQALAAENANLRATLGNGNGPCPYCSLPREKWAECASGFPGCGRADDAMLCPHVGAELASQEKIDTLTSQISALQEQIRKDAYAAFKAEADFEVELDALRLLLRRNEVRVGRQRELLQENNKLLDRARAAEASNAKLRAALRHLFPFVDRAVGEGIVFGPDGKALAMDALDIYAAAGRALGFEGVDDEALMVLSAPGDTPPAAATVPVLYLNYRGDIAPRHIVPIRFWEGESEWHPGEHHFLRVIEPSTRKVRDFAFSGILAWGQAAIDQLESNDRTFQMLRDDLAAERDAKVCGEIEVRRHGLDPADPDSLHLRIAISQQQLISGGLQILDPILEKAKAELSAVLKTRLAVG